MKVNMKKIVLTIPIVVIVIAAIFLLINLVEDKETIMTGIVDCTEVDVSSKIPGRLEQVIVKEGDQVIKGNILATLESKEMDAKVEQARGVKDAAFAKMTLVKKGARDEEKKAVQNLYMQAKYQFDYVAKTWDRFQQLFADKVISEQERDEMEFKYNAAKEQMEAAKAKLDMVNKGARDEEITAVESLYHQAENAYNEASAYQEELTLSAPISGEISEIYADPGEVINSGYPVFSILDLDDSYVVLQVREDKMEEMTKGKIFMGRIPALGNNEYEFEVSFIAPMADFATWKPTNMKGDFDLMTFEIHLRSVDKIENLRPGMTVNISL